MKSNNNSEFEVLVQKISEATTMNDKEISLKVGRNAGYIAQLRSRIKNGEEEIPVKFIDLLKLHFAKELSKTGSDRQTDDTKIKEISGSDFSELLYQNRLMAEALKLAGEERVITAKSALIDAEARKRLINSIGDLAQAAKSTADAVPETQRDEIGITGDLLEVLAELGVGTHWKSKQEGVRILGMRLLPGIEKKEKTGTPFGASK